MSCESVPAVAYETGRSIDGNGCSRALRRLVGVRPIRGSNAQGAFLRRAVATLEDLDRADAFLVQLEAVQIDVWMMTFLATLGLASSFVLNESACSLPLQRGEGRVSAARH